MSIQLERAAVFHRLHVKGAPVVLFNIWDAGTARAVARAGARAIATGSWSVAAAHGYEDGERLPFALAVANLREIVGAVDLPVTLDLEAGYGPSSDAVADSVSAALEAGAIGFNLEDQIIGGGPGAFYSIADQSARLRAARAAAERAAIPAFINARTDLFLHAEPAHHNAELVDQALQRAGAYAESGASGFFAPGLVDEALIGKLCAACSLPVNILARPHAPSAQRLADLGVARISHGPGPYREAMGLLENAARKVLGG
jgi:2-methylisocitrate lyase-like PEP mutase family enzyme